MGTEATLGLADPARLAWCLAPANSGAGPPLHWGCALGGKLACDLGRGIGGEGEEVGRERDRRQGFTNPVARHYLVFRELDGQVQRRRAVALDPLRGLLRQPCNDLLQHHTVDDLVDAAFPGQKPSAARVPELLSHHEGSAVFPQLQRPKPLAVLFGVPADPLEDGSLEVVVD